jgi:hypothetical protein
MFFKEVISMGLFDVFRRKNDVQEDILYAD